MCIRVRVFIIVLSSRRAGKLCFKLYTARRTYLYMKYAYNVRARTHFKQLVLRYVCTSYCTWHRRQYARGCLERQFYIWHRAPTAEWGKKSLKKNSTIIINNKLCPCNSIMSFSPDARQWEKKKRHNVFRKSKYTNI